MSKAAKTVAELESMLSEAGDKLVLIDFHATWCGPCKRIAPLLEELAVEHKDTLVVIKVDVDEVEELVATYKVKVMPTFVLKRRGEHLDTLSGANEDKLKELVTKHLPSK